MWAHPYVNGAGHVVLQYWYCYPFNDHISDHEGDWEHVNVVLNEDRASIREIHYYFHGRSVHLPQGEYLPEIQDGTHPVIYVGGRAYMVWDYPTRLFNGDHNSGSHGNYPYPGEWEAAAAVGHTETVMGRSEDAGRTVDYHEFRTVLTPEASRVDYRTHPEVLLDWAPLLMPVRWGFPSGPSVASAFKLTDVGNRAPFGPAFNAGWNRTAPGLAYPSYRVRRIPTMQSYLEDLLQPWYYAYTSVIHDTCTTRAERLSARSWSAWGSPLEAAGTSAASGHRSSDSTLAIRRRISRINTRPRLDFCCGGTSGSRHASVILNWAAATRNSRRMRKTRGPSSPTPLRLVSPCTAQRVTCGPTSRWPRARAAGNLGSASPARTRRS